MVLLICLLQINSTTFLQCRMGLSGPNGTPLPKANSRLHDNLDPTTTSSLLLPALHITITKIRSFGVTFCGYIYWLNVSDAWFVSYATVTTLEPLITIYPATVTGVFAFKC